MAIGVRLHRRPGDVGDCVDPGVGVSAGIAERLVSSHLRTALVAVALAASVALIYVTLYMSFTPVGYFIIDGVQGRSSSR